MAARRNQGGHLRAEVCAQGVRHRGRRRGDLRAARLRAEEAHGLRRRVRRGLQGQRRVRVRATSGLTSSVHQRCAPGCRIACSAIFNWLLFQWVLYIQSCTVGSGHCESTVASRHGATRLPGRWAKHRRLMPGPCKGASCSAWRSKVEKVLWAKGGAESALRRCHTGGTRRGRG